MFIHCVYFWLNDGVSAEARQALQADCETLLKQIPSVKSLYAGRPAMTPRPVVDNSYDVGLCVILDDSAGHDVYQEHPLHKEFIARHKPIWKKVLIYDFI